MDTPAPQTVTELDCQTVSGAFARAELAFGKGSWRSGPLAAQAGAQVQSVLDRPRAEGAAVLQLPQGAEEASYARQVGVHQLLVRFSGIRAPRVEEFFPPFGLSNRTRSALRNVTISSSVNGL